jgi:cyclopropane fatty-acyl-phospholipid synthase-like methyltransferase
MWQEIWERKGQEQVEDYDLETLLRLDGFDVGLGRATPEAFLRVAEMVRREIDLGPGQRLLEVGCGAGALLWCFRDDGLKLCGVDYSSALIEHARRALPDGEFAVSEATDIAFTADAAVSVSVFHYFPDLDYARRVVDAMRKAAAIVLIVDVPDEDTREEALEERRKAGSDPGEHLYYPRSFFDAKKTWTNDHPGWANGRFRFNALVVND